MIDKGSTEISNDQELMLDTLWSLKTALDGRQWSQTRLILLENRQSAPIRMMLLMALGPCFRQAAARKALKHTVLDISAEHAFFHSLDFYAKVRLNLSIKRLRTQWSERIPDTWIDDPDPLERLFFTLSNEPVNRLNLPLTIQIYLELGLPIMALHKALEEPNELDRMKDSFRGQSLPLINQ